MMKIRLFLVALLILVFSLSGCGLLTGGEQQKVNPQGEVQTEPSDRDETDPSQAEQKSQNDALAEDFVCELYPLLNNEVLFKLTNNSERDISSLAMHVEFYDEQENILTDYETYFYGVTTGQVLYAFSTHLKDYEVDWEKHRITYEPDYDAAYRLHDYSGAIGDIEIDDEIREGNGYTYYVAFRNMGSETIDYVNAFILFYHEDELTGAGELFAQDIAPGGSAELSFIPTTDTTNRMIPYDRYEAVLSQAYYKK
jgi:hypothetical protein